MSLFDFGDISAPKGSERWAVGVHHEAIAALNAAVKACEHAEVWTRALRETGAYRHLKDGRGRAFPTWDTYCAARQPAGLGHSPTVVDRVVAAAAGHGRQNGHGDGHIPLAVLERPPDRCGCPPGNRLCTDLWLPTCQTCGLPAIGRATRGGS